MPRIYNCGCGKETVLFSLYFEFEDELVYKVKAHMCEECLRDEGLWCEDHGPISLTNHPSLLESLPKEEMDSMKGAAFAFCIGCIREQVTDLDDEISAEYLKVISSRCAGESLEGLEKITNLFLPGRIFQKRPILSACGFLSHITASSMDVTVSGVADIPLPGSAQARLLEEIEKSMSE